MLDQRGTGNSSPIGARVVRDGDQVSAELRPPLAGLDASAQAEYLTHFRADEIVNDAELIREALGAQQWTLLGQSFGGFTSLHYLSVHPESLAGAIITGGLSAVRHPIDDVYATTWAIMMAKSEEYYRRFPGDRERIVALTKLCEQGRIVLPNGDRVSAERFRTVGHHLGMQDGAAELHQLLALPHDGSAFAHDLAESLAFGGRNPIYAVLHESSYADGVVTGWSADRTMPDRVREDPTLLAGEHIHRSLFSEDFELGAFAEAADLVAQHQWNQLYFPRQARPGRRTGGGLCVLRGRLRAAGVLDGDRGHPARLPHLGDQRVRAQRAADGHAGDRSPDRAAEGQPLAVAEPATRPAQARSISGSR